MILLIVSRDWGWFNSRGNFPGVLVLNRREIADTVLVERDKRGDLTACKLPGRNAKVFTDESTVTYKPSPIKHGQFLRVGSHLYTIVDGLALFNSAA